MAEKDVEGSADMLVKAVSFALAPRHRRVLTIHFASARCRSLVPNQPDVYAFSLVRGSTQPGGLQPAAEPGLGFRNDDVRF